VILRKEVLLPEVCDYFQIDAPPGKSYHSPSMGSRSFPLEDSAFAPEQLFHWVFDDRQLDAATRVRHVVLKTSGVDMRSVRTGRPSGGAGRRDAPRQTRMRSGPTIYVHCAAETHNRDAALAGLQEQRDHKLADIEEQTKDSLRDLRGWLLAISIA